MRLSDSSPSRQSLEQSLERLMQTPSARRGMVRAWGPWVRSRLGQLVTFLTETRSLQVQQRRDRAGSPYWLVYDDHSRHTFRFDSEQEVRIWLEQRYRS